MDDKCHLCKMIHSDIHFESTLYYLFLETLQMFGIFFGNKSHAESHYRMLTTHDVETGPSQASYQYLALFWPFTTGGWPPMVRRVRQTSSCPQLFHREFPKYYLLQGSF